MTEEKHQASGEQPCQRCGKGVKSYTGGLCESCELLRLRRPQSSRGRHVNMRGRDAVLTSILGPDMAQATATTAISPK